jgi:phosphoenolpyruvate carboxykinase (GTP)
MIPNSRLAEWVQSMASICKPESIHWCDGSQIEYDSLCGLLVGSGTFITLNPTLRPNCFLARSDPSDVARVEERTFISSLKREDAGPTNNWCDPVEMKARMIELFTGSMEGRTMYVVPFSMGPIGSRMSMTCVELTDSPYVVCNMRIMTRMGRPVLDRMRSEGSFVPCLHSVGMPLKEGQKDVPWPCNNVHKYIVHFPESREIWSYGSGYGGNALLGKKCLSLRIASVIARDEGWLAEHMLVVGVTSPEGEKMYFSGAFPSACGKTNLALMVPRLPGWKVTLIGDDIAWLRFGPDGKLHAMNPEHGLFGVAPGTSMVTNPNAMEACARDSIFTNVALTPEGDVWWEGMTMDAPPELIDWKGERWVPGCGRVAAHPNSRYTTPIQNVSVLDSRYEDPEGVPISAILLGGRRKRTVPLVVESFDWEHGVFLGSIMGSERTSAAEGRQGVLQRDPFAMLPFCGYNMGDYLAHWVRMKDGRPRKDLPRLYMVNWFKRSSDGRFLWPGFGENIRVIKWAFERSLGRSGAVASPIGNLPRHGDLDIGGLNVTDEDMVELFKVDKGEWLEEVQGIRKLYDDLSEVVPRELMEWLRVLEGRIDH